MSLIKPIFVHTDSMFLHTPEIIRFTGKLICPHCNKINGYEKYLLEEKSIERCINCQGSFSIHFCYDKEVEKKQS